MTNFKYSTENHIRSLSSNEPYTFGTRSFFFNHAFALNNSPGAVDEYGRYMAVVGILLSRSANGVRER